MNGRYMREMDIDEYTSAVAAFTGLPDGEKLKQACAIAQEKAQTLADVRPLVAFFFEEPVEDEKAWRKTMKEDAPRVLEAVTAALEPLEDFGFESVEAALSPLPDVLGLKPGKVYQPIRVSITGTTVSPGIFETVSVLGKEETLSRIGTALAKTGKS